MIENILILDTETTGLDPKKDAKVIELGVVLFNVEHRAILQCFSTLLPCEDNPVESINHISPNATQCRYPHSMQEIVINDAWRNPQSAEAVYIENHFEFFMDRIILEMAKHCDAVVAHNAPFDRSFMTTLPCYEYLAEKKWICTKSNFTWPVPLKRFRLEDICYAMQVPYIQAHRALNDCLLLAQCFKNIPDLQERFNRCIS